MRPSNPTAAEALDPLVRSLIGDGLPICIRCWDGSSIGPKDSASAIVLHSPKALRRLLWAPGELGLGRAYVAGEIDIEGDIYDLLGLRDRMGDPAQHVDVRIGLRQRRQVLEAAARLGAIGPPPPPPPEEAHQRGRLHSPGRDAAAITHHYDVSNEFYRLVLGDTMTYSCAYFHHAGISLDEAQEAKYGHICRKLELRPGMRLLDVGCGWGGMLLHAAAEYGVKGVGVTVSSRQAELARKRVADVGLTSQVDIRLMDYREIDDGPYDAISSIGMFEHVGLSHLAAYFAELYALLRPEGRLLNHGISRPAGKGGFDRNSFIARYVFPDGELHEVGRVVSTMQAQGFEVRDVEGLREHYGLTLRDWVRNLEENWDAAVRLVGPARARIWHLYMAASAVNFEANRTGLHQVLGVRTDSDGSSGMPPTRAAWVV